MNRIFAYCLCILSLLTMAGCGNTGNRAPSAATEPPTSEPAPKISSIEAYNRTGKIQKEDFYRYTNGKAEISYSIEYSYNDAGRISTIRKNGGGLGENKAIEAYLYSGDNCTQRVLYDENGGTRTVYYWTYQKNKLVSERIVSMIPAENGYSYSGKEETITNYNEDGTASEKKYSAPENYETDEYEYDEEGNLLVDRYSHSSDGETFRLFETRAYVYDGENRLTRQTKTDALGNVFSMGILEYNETGKIVSDTVYSSDEIKDDNILTRKVYEYTDGGMLNSLTEYAGEETTQTFYEYNSAGNTTITTVLKSSVGRPPEKTVTTVEYDARQNPVAESIRYPDGTETVLFRCSYEYYDDGKILNKINYVI